MNDWKGSRGHLCGCLFIGHICYLLWLYIWHHEMIFNHKGTLINDKYVGNVMNLLFRNFMFHSYWRPCRRSKRPPGLQIIFTGTKRFLYVVTVHSSVWKDTIKLFSTIDSLWPMAYMVDAVIRLLCSGSDSLEDCWVFVLYILNLT